MIPTLGVMIGMYIVMRAIDLMTDRDRGVGPKIVAGLTLAVALFGMFDLVTTGSQVATGLVP